MQYFSCRGPFLLGFRQYEKEIEGSQLDTKSIPKLIDDLTFYGLMKEYVQQMSYISHENDQISDLVAKYCENPDRVTQAKTYFVIASRYLQSKDGLQKEIIDLLPDCYAI